MSAPTDMNTATEMPAIAAQLNSKGRDGSARHAALALRLPEAKSPTSLVAYKSKGRLLIVGPGSSVRLAAENVSTALAVTLLITDAGGENSPPQSEDSGSVANFRSIHAQVAEIRGYLGNFQVDILSEGEVRPLAPSILTAEQAYDLVLDLGSTAQIRSEVIPPGYYAPGRDGERIHQALQAMPDLVGEFEKPRYLDYQADICAHSSRGLLGCRRCLDACPADAIISIGEHIEVDPHLCQGGGSCTSSCPTGALHYAFPALPDLLARLQTLLRGYLQAGGVSPCVFLHDCEAGQEWLLKQAGALPDNCLPFSLEEVASVGMESWLSLLAFGASGVAVLCHEQTPATVRSVLQEQIRHSRVLLTGMGYPGDRILALEAADPSACLSALAGFGPALVTTPARFLVVDEKRTTLRQALDHLYSSAPLQAVSIDLPPGAAFGEIRVDKSTCTLCMSCASVCPAGAVLVDGDLPQLKFIEQNCVQCGLCASACPEDSISLRPRMLYPLEERSRRRILNEDQPFHCLRCNTPFATTRTIEAILGKLAGHWMYVDKPEQLRRLKMCEECRVRDMFEHDGPAMDVHGD